MQNSNTYISRISATGKWHCTSFHRGIVFCAVEILVLRPVHVTTLTQATTFELKRKKNIIESVLATHQVTKYL